MTSAASAFDGRDVDDLEILRVLGPVARGRVCSTWRDTSRSTVIIAMLVLRARRAHTSRFSTPRYAASYIRLCMRFMDTPANAGRAQSWSSATGTSRSRRRRGGRGGGDAHLLVPFVRRAGRARWQNLPAAGAARAEPAECGENLILRRGAFLLLRLLGAFPVPSQSAPKGSPTDSSHSSRGSPSPRASLRPTLRASFFFSFSSFLSRALVMVTEALGAPSRRRRARAAARRRRRPASSPAPPRGGDAAAQRLPSRRAARWRP